MSIDEGDYVMKMILDSKAKVFRVQQFFDAGTRAKINDSRYLSDAAIGIDPSAHFCPTWDGLLVCTGDEGMGACLCETIWPRRYKPDAIKHKAEIIKRRLVCAPKRAVASDHEEPCYYCGKPTLEFGLVMTGCREIRQHQHRACDQVFLAERKRRNEKAAQELAAQRAAGFESGLRPEPIGPGNPACCEDWADCDGRVIYHDDFCSPPRFCPWCGVKLMPLDESIKRVEPRDPMVTDLMQSNVEAAIFEAVDKNSAEACTGNNPESKVAS